MEELEKLRLENEKLKKNLSKTNDKLTTLIAENIKLKAMNKANSAAVKSLKEVVDIAQLTNKRNSINLALTCLNEYLESSCVFIMKKNHDETYSIVNTSVTYSNTPDNKMQNKYQSHEFVSIYSMLANQFEEDDENILLDLDETFTNNFGILKHNDIKRISMTNISENEYEYFIIAINVEKENNCELIKSVCPTFVAALERRRLSVTDSFTNIYNREYYREVMQQFQTYKRKSINYIMIDLFRLKFINDNYGHKYGDIYIKTAAKILLNVFPHDYIFHFGGDEFGIIIPDKSQDEIEERMQIAATLMERANITANGDTLTTVMNYGIAHGEGEYDLESLSHEADLIMEQNKRIYYSNANVDRRK